LQQNKDDAKNGPWYLLPHVQQSDMESQKDYTICDGRHSKAHSILYLSATPTTHHWLSSTHAAWQLTTAVQQLIQLTICHRMQTLSHTRH